MRYRIHLSIVIILILAFAFLGITKRQSYTNIGADEDYLSRMFVAELPQELVEQTCNDLLNNLPSANIVLRISPIEDMEHLFGCSQQKVCVQEVFSGTQVSVGEILYVTSAHWNLCIDDTLNSIELGFVNIMKKGYDYLIFLDEQVSVTKDQVPVYKLYEECTLTPIFCYDDFENITIPTTGISTYVPYNKVQNNEFFVTDELGLEMILSLKNVLLSRYPSNPI